MVNGEAFDFKNNVRLPAGKNALIFNFSVIDFKSLGHQQLFYSVNGKTWSKAEMNMLQLTELAPGKYTIRLFSKKDHSDLKSKEIVLRFEILAPFYQRWWFLGIVGILLAFVGFLLFKRRLNQIEQKNQILQEKLNLEKQLQESSLAAIKSQMNPHFIFNALNTIQSFIYTNEKQAASSYLVDFSELTRKILEMSNKPYVSLFEELEALELYLKLEKMRFEDDFDFEMDTRNLPHNSYQIPSMLIQPYVENAIKHGLLHKKGHKKLSLTFTIEENILFVSVIDNGIGISASKKINEQRSKNHKSFAMEATEKRFILLNQFLKNQIGIEISDLTDENKKVTGTIVKLSIHVK